MIKLSVVIATFNRADGLVRTLDSLLKQDLDSSLWEIVVVDNNSSDATAQRVESYVREHTTHTIQYCFESNQGLSFARNAGIRAAVGEYIVMVDDDEIFCESFLSSYFSLFETNPLAMVAGGRVEPLYEFELPQWLNSYLEMPIAGTVDFACGVKFFPTSRYPTGGNMAFRTCVFDKVGLFNTDLGRKGSSLMGGEEKDLFERIGERVYYCYDALMYHIIPQSRVTVDYIYKVSTMIGRSERLRTKARGIYGKRLFMELVKWGGTLVISLGYILMGRFSSARVLCGFRLRITKGLINLS